ncbi:MAG: hypothetical protein Q8P18_20010 [Pseudomonadota bacterium]|nr:hypothetical protein [Pseudomonadota bacterium]
MSSRDKSELERGLQSLGRVFTGVTGRLLGPKAIGREELPPESSISPEADAALEKAGADLGRILHATGEGLKAHPLDPSGALRTARASASAGDPVESDPGWTPLAAGLKNLGGGLAKVAEGVLDVVAPRKPRTATDEDAPKDTAQDEEGPGEA